MLNDIHFQDTNISFIFIHIYHSTYLFKEIEKKLKYLTCNIFNLLKRVITHANTNSKYLTMKERVGVAFNRNGGKQ